MIALGANLPSVYGAPAATLSKAVDVVQSRGINVLTRSGIWLTAPVPISDQPWYHNAVIAVQTRLSPNDLLKELLSIENEFGRVRSERNAPRILDLDLLAYGDAHLNDADLTLPHPRMMERGFVLYPLLDVAAEWTHPVTGQRAQEAVRHLPPNQSAEKSSFVL